MKSLIRFGATIGVATLLAGCGAASAPPIAASPANATLSGTRLNRLTPTGSQRYEYVIQGDGSTGIFDYPKSDKEIGSFTSVVGQACTNTLYGYGKKIFWIVGGAGQITEYDVLKKSVRTLSVNYSFPSSCAMDTSGDLAVGILYGTSDGTGGGDVVVFKDATGTPTVYSTPLDEEFFDGYDAKGDLFADGFTGDRSGFALVELPRDGKKFVTIATSNTVKFPGSVQWDGRYLSVYDQEAGAIYRYAVSGTMATLKGTVSLANVGDCAQTASSSSRGIGANVEQDSNLEPLGRVSRSMETRRADRIDPSCNALSAAL